MGARMKIGFIGLGNMGSPMAKNLIKAGHELSCFDISSIQDDLPFAASAKDVAIEADIVILMLPHAQAVMNVTDDILDHMQAGSLIIDCSTIDVKSAKSLSAKATDKNILSLDAPVSGGIAAAAAASLTFMAGGTNEAFERARPILDMMGARVIHCGDAGSGQAAKICNNMILGISMIGTCEAFILADKLGLDRQSLFDVVSTSSGQSWSMTSYCPAPGIGPQSPSDNDYRPGFSTDLMLKDLRLSQQAASENSFETSMGALATELYRQYVEDEDGAGRDFSAMILRLAGKTAS